jgi:hypothetical protein
MVFHTCVWCGRLKTLVVGGDEGTEKERELHPVFELTHGQDRNRTGSDDPFGDAPDDDIRTDHARLARKLLDVGLT